MASTSRDGNLNDQSRFDENDFVEYRCPHPDCKKTKRTFKNKVVHWQMKHATQNENGKVKCQVVKDGNLCGAIIGAKGYDGHFNSHHKPKTETPMFPCTVCDKSFFLKCHLNYHMRTHKEKDKEKDKGECDICHKKMNKKSIKRHKRQVHGNERYKCAQCTKSYIAKSSLQVHVNVIHNKLTYKCDHEECNAEYANHGALSHHRDTKHRDISYKCQKCEKKFTSKRKLNEHTQVIHDGKLFECTKCDKKFSKYQSLKIHIDAQHDHSIYKCTKCFLKFHSLYGLQYHNIMHHSMRIYKCAHCDKIFHNFYYFKMHQGRMYTCRLENCNKKFGCISQRKAHIDQDHEIKCYQPECNGMKFDKRSQLYQHNQAKHIKVKCQLCDKTFSSSKIYEHKFGKSSIHKSAKCEICKKKFNYLKNEFEHYAINHENCNICDKKFESIKDVKTCQNTHKIIDVVAYKTCERMKLEMIPATFFSPENNNLIIKDEDSDMLIVNRSIVSSLTGSLSINANISDNVDCKYTSANEITILSPYVIIEMDNRGTLSMIEEIIPTKIVKSQRPNYYFEYSTDLKDGLEVAKIKHLEGFDFSHLATSYFARNQSDRICRNMKINLTLNHSRLNQVATSNLEKYIFRSTKDMIEYKKLAKKIRQVVLIHETENIKRDDHEIGKPAFVLNILQYIYEDETYELRLFLFPNAPIYRSFEDFEITERQREILFPHMKILNEITISDGVFLNKDYHMSVEKTSEDSLTLEQWKEIIKMNRQELETSKYYTDLEYFKIDESVLDIESNEKDYEVEKVTDEKKDDDDVDEEDEIDYQSDDDDDSDNNEEMEQ